MIFHFQMASNGNIWRGTPILRHTHINLDAGKCIKNKQIKQASHSFSQYDWCSSAARKATSILFSLEVAAFLLALTNYGNLG